MHFINSYFSTAEEKMFSDKNAPGIYVTILILFSASHCGPHNESSKL
jgi:hypothetical protein